MNCTKKESSTVIPRVLSLAVILVISRTCYCILHDPSYFMVASSVISIPISDLSVEWKRSSISLRYYKEVTFSGRADLMLLAIVIRMKLRHNLLDLSHALCFDFSASLLIAVMSAGFSSNSAKSRSKTPKWKLTYSRHSEKFKPLKMVTAEACEWRETAANI